MRRSDQRRDAVFALYQHEVTGRPLEDLLSAAKPFTRELALGVASERAGLDEELSAFLHDWTLERVAPLERSIMRVAIYELRHCEAIPTEVALDEAVNLAKRYCSADAPKFVNGVLGAAARQATGSGDEK